MNNDEKRAIIEAASDAKFIAAARNEWPKDLARLELIETAAQQLVDEINRLNPIASVHNHSLRRLAALLREGY